MYIQNAVYKAVPTGSLEFPVAEGAIITVGGVTGIVPQNVALAPPMAMIYVATGGTIDLTSEANKDVTFTEAQIKELGADFNFIPASEGGGGSSLPTYTSADKGKVLTVGEGSVSETVVIVPAQEIANDGENPAHLSNVAITASDVVVGETVNCEISKDGVVKDLVLTGVTQGDVSGYYYTDGETAETQMLFFNNEWIFTTTEMTGNIIVYVYKEDVSVEPKWVKKGVTKVAVTHDLENDIYSANYSGPFEGMIFACEDHDNDVVFSPFALFEHTSFGATTIRSYAVKIDSDGTLTGMAASYRTDIGVLSLYPLGGGD